MDKEKVFQQFLLFAGLLEETGKPWRSLCDAACVQLESRVLPDMELDDVRLILAAAGEAFCRYALSQSGGTAQSFTVGGISVSENGGSIQNAAALRDELLAGAAGLLRFDCGILRTVSNP